MDEYAGIFKTVFVKTRLSVVYAGEDFRVVISRFRPVGGRIVRGRI